MPDEMARKLKSIGLIAWHCPHCGTFQGCQMSDGRLCTGFPGETHGYVRTMRWDCVCGQALHWNWVNRRETNLKTKPKKGGA